MFSSRSKRASLKDGILDQIGEQIKALQIGQQNASEEGDTNYKVTSRNVHLQCLLDLLDHILLHGLVNPENGYWPFVKKLTHSETVKLISRHPQVSNDLDKGRVWVFVAVCEGLLESYIRLFMEGQKAAKKLYTKDAFLRDKERLVILQTLVSGLDFVQIVLDMNCPYLGYGGLPAPLTKDNSVPHNNIKYSPRQAGHSRESSISASSSYSNSSTILAPSSPTDLHSTDAEIFDLPDQSETPTNFKVLASNGVSNHRENELEGRVKIKQFNDSSQNETCSTDEDMASKHLKEIKNPLMKVVGKSMNTERSDDTKALRQMDPHFSTSDEDLANDFRTRLGSNLSEISMEDVDLVVHHEHIRSRRIMRKKRRVTSPEKKRQEIPKEDQKGLYYQCTEDNYEPHYPCPEDYEDENSEDQNEGGVTKVYARTSSYLSEGLQDSESAASSVVSGDSLDQFCRDADFGSLNNLSSDTTIQSTVIECRNEPVEVKEERPGADNVDDEKPTAVKNEECESTDVMNTSSDYEGIILGLPKRPSLQDTPGNSCDVKMDGNTVLMLSLEIFKNSDEQFHRMLCTSTGHQFGQLQSAHAMITDFAVYLLRKVTFREETSYHVDVVIEFSNIKSIEIGLNCQTVTVSSKKERFTITFGNEAVSRSFISSLTSQVSRCYPSMSLSHLVSSTALQQEATLTKWMSKEKHLNMSTQNTSCFSLVRWCGLTGPDSQIEVLSFRSVMEGTLEFRQHNYLRMSSKWTKGYFVLTNGTLWQYLNQNDKVAKNMFDLRGFRCGGCRQLHDADRPYAFEIVSSDGTGSLLVLAAKNEHEACEWIFKICQSIAESYDDDSDRGCTVMKCVPCCLVTTKEKIVIFLSHPSNENEYKYITSCPLQNITKIFVDNSYRNYCIIKFDYSEVISSEGSWFVWFNTEFELGKFERAVAEAWRELFQVDLQFLVLGNNTTRHEARERAKNISQFSTNKS